MPLLITVHVATADTPTINRRIYPLALLEKMAETFNHPVALTAAAGPMPDPIGLDNIIGTVENLVVIGRELAAILNITDTHPGLVVQKLLNEGYLIPFTLSGDGAVNDDGVVQNDYILHSLALNLDAIVFNQRLAKVLRAKMKANYGRSRG